MSALPVVREATATTALSPLNPQNPALPVNRPRPLRRQEAANYITETYNFPCSAKTLAKLAVVGGGPRFFKAGKFPLHDIPDLDAWAQAKLSEKVSSTAELKEGAA